MLRMKHDLKTAMIESSLKDNDIWKFDMLFKISTAIKKMHDVGVLHLDIKE